MSIATDNLQAAQARARELRPAVGGFPVLARVLHDAGVRSNEWLLPSAQSIYRTEKGPVVEQGQPIATGVLDVPEFDEGGVVRALRADQAGQTAFAEFLIAIWEAGVTRFVVDLHARNVTYYGCNGESYLEEYPDADLAQWLAVSVCCSECESIAGTAVAQRRERIRFLRWCDAEVIGGRLAMRAMQPIAAG
ncbi:DUF1398 domain-containing protein [Gryllotalpicola reticulitermitis]|uniref:DUF1398 domain-containing protein n=1 Tax=Gryllotalpicola reticulitermitis TaxID=1184153 RepID=A0ABV8Q241_9MICO